MSAQNQLASAAVLTAFFLGQLSGRVGAAPTQSVLAPNTIEAIGVVRSVCTECISKETPGLTGICRLRIGGALNLHFVPPVLKRILQTDD